jgi:hypothetical protein
MSEKRITRLMRRLEMRSATKLQQQSKTSQLHLYDA